MGEGLIVGRRSRGCRGKASKKRSREKWLLKIGAAYAHHGDKRHCGLSATSCAERSAHRASLAGGAATGDMGSRTPQSEAKRQGIAPRPTGCAICALTGAANEAHQEKDTATRAVAVEAGDVVVGQRGDSDLYTPADKVDGENGGANGEMTTVPIVATVAVVLWWADAWRAVTGLSLASAAVLSLWLVCQLGQWHERGVAQFTPVAAVKNLLGGHKRPRLTRHRRAKIEDAWKRVFRAMVGLGMAGELPQRRLQVKQLEAQLAKAQRSLAQADSKLKTETNKLKNGRFRVIAEAKERHFLAGRLEGLQEALPVERENQELRLQMAQQAAQFNEKLLGFQRQLQGFRAQTTGRVTVAALVPGDAELDLATWLLVGLPAKCWRFRADYRWDTLLGHTRERAVELGFSKKSWDRQLRDQEKSEQAARDLSSIINPWESLPRYQKKPKPWEEGFPW